MIHDELLIEVNRRLEVALYNGDPQSIHALRAVVELHKPIVKNEYYVEMDEEPVFICECDPYDEYDMGYPCETIEAIQEQLK